MKEAIEACVIDMQITYVSNYNFLKLHTCNWSLVIACQLCD